MIQKNYPTEQGLITYWINTSKIPTKPWLVFLPGLTANHHLFKDQLEHFKGKGEPTCMGSTITRKLPTV